MKIKPLIKIIRPYQWIKNVVVLLPLFFGGTLFVWHSLFNALLSAAAFSLVCSSIYCLNDIIDVEADRRHKEKCRRPIASGEVTKASAYALCISLVAVALLFAFLLVGNGFEVMLVLLGYWLLNVAYCLWLKRWAIVDVSVIAFGFVLRLMAGGVAGGVALSHWIVLMTFLLMLFLSLAKRRDDVLKMELTGEAPRKNTSRYNLTFINQAITITSSVTLVCYIMYTVSPEVTERFQNHSLYLTTVFVLLGLLRYLQLALVDQKTGDPARIMLRDKALQVILGLWALSFLVIIYFND